MAQHRASPLAASTPRHGDTIVRQVYLIIGLFAFIILCMLALDRFQTYMLDSVRAYVAAEAFWSKGQKDAAFHLARYASSHNENQYRMFQHGLAVTLGDREARQALQAPVPDRARARQGFLIGRNQVGDLPQMISAFLRFQNIGPMRHAIDIWTAADRQIDVLRQLGRQLHQALSSGTASPARIHTLLRQVDVTNARASGLEAGFSHTLENEALAVHRLADLAMLTCSLLLLGLGTILSRRIIGRIRRTQDELEASEMRLRQVLATDIVGVAFWDNDGDIVDANAAYLSMLGYTREDLAQRRLNWRRMTPESYREKDQETVRIIREQGFRSHYEKEYLHKDGHRVAALMGAARLDEQGGVAFVLDISEQKRMEVRLQQVEKMEAIATLVGGIAHDFNNTLAATQGNLYLAKQYAKDQPRIAEKLDVIEGLGTHSAEIVKQLLTFANKGIVHMEAMSLNDLCTRIERLAAPRLTEGVAFDMETCGETLTIKGDAAQLEQVMMHLLTNARDALDGTPAPAISCRLSRLEPDGAFRDKHRRLAAGPVAHVQLHDNGCGMSEDTLSHVFEPFFTTKEVGKGTGLGMAMVYGSMRAHRGAVTVDSTPGRGTTVNLYLPLLD